MERNFKTHLLIQIFFLLWKIKLLYSCFFSLQEFKLSVFPVTAYIQNVIKPLKLHWLSYSIVEHFQSLDIKHSRPLRKNKILMELPTYYLNN